MQIPLNNSFEDFVSWKGNSSIIFSVRSAYHIEWRHQYNGQTCRSLVQGTAHDNPIWKILWKLDVPAKVKKICWCALHGILPLKSILVNRHIGTSGQCPVCNLWPEDVLYMLFQCQPASELWKFLGLDTIIADAMQSKRSGSLVLEELLRSNPYDAHGYSSFKLHELIAITCWYIWWMRRKRTHGESVPLSFKCATSIRGLVANYARAKKVQNQVA
jgi:hypothetical protein